MQEFTHFNKKGEAIMVDVSNKDITHRQAIATGNIKLNEVAYELVKNGGTKKGDVIATARLAAIMASKQTAQLIPLCHPIALTNATVDFNFNDEDFSIDIFATVKTDSKTGVEMEALIAVNIGLLTIYDMCKAIDKSLLISNIHLVKKTGGKSGEFLYRS